MKVYCEACKKEVDTEVITKQETYPVLGEAIKITANVLVCKECGSELFSFELDTENLQKAYSVYRKKHKLLLPEEIKAIREQYELSQRGFSKLLNWGDKTIRRYENGSLQDKAHNSLLLFLRKPSNMKEYLCENEVPLDEKQKQELLEKVNSLLDEKKDKINMSVGSSVSIRDNLEMNIKSMEKGSYNNFLPDTKKTESSMVCYVEADAEKKSISYSSKNYLEDNDDYVIAA